MNDCPFCTIDHEVTRIVREYEHVLVILSNPRLVPGHCLVIPRRHVLRLSELRSEERVALFDAVVEMQDMIVARFVKGCDIREHYRPFLSQSNVKVDHVHIHLQPRALEDELYKRSQKYEQTLWQPLTKEECERFVVLYQAQ